MFQKPAGASFRECFLFTGPEGVGKTHQVFNIAKRLQKSGSPGQVYVFDTDDAYPGYLTSKTSPFYGLKNVHPIYTATWEDYTTPLPDIAAQVKPEDWIVCDFYGRLWQFIRRFYAVKVLGHATLQDFYLEQARYDELKKEAMAKPKGSLTAKDKEILSKSYGGFSGDQWGAMNDMYFAAEDILLSARCNVILTAEEDVIDSRDNKTVSTYQEHFPRALKAGVKPRGQKSMPHRPATWLHFMGSDGDYAYTTFKDRYGREYQDERALRDITRSYLEVMGWNDGEEDA